MRRLRYLSLGLTRQLSTRVGQLDRPPNDPNPAPSRPPAVDQASPLSRAHVVLHARRTLPAQPPSNLAHARRAAALFEPALNELQLPGLRSRQSLHRCPHTAPSLPTPPPEQRPDGRGRSDRAGGRWGSGTLPNAGSEKA